MNSRIKVFSSFKELDEEKKYKYFRLEKFNDSLEREWIKDYKEIYDSYIKNIISTDKNIDFSNYSELDFQIKYLIEEEKVAVNSILEFAWEKFSTYEKLLIDLFDRSSIFSPFHKVWTMVWILKDLQEVKNELIYKILKLKKWELVIKFINPIDFSNRTYLINFDLNNLWEFEKFEEEILSFDVDKIMNENNMIIEWIWIMKS